ncbi:hypothetical protein HQ393_06995 [Chitinibacter bivalviorum]|uniref:Peptidase MA-like domain-containing protein n=1 Tax=Chitinibacter bivalviorum TaxID=2739434 RepID=A0A7H9BIC4_9NEIS|nr:hypothetical protein [Chitinibacter bivalviorum]QLG88026.1 hypothetical protein HQ393_06995 [Chitinibacter bivalviorum]
MRSVKYAAILLILVFLAFISIFSIKIEGDYTAIIQNNNKQELNLILEMTNNSIANVSSKLWPPEKFYLVACESDWCYRLFSPFFDKENGEKGSTIFHKIIALNKKGLNEIIISHEITHVATKNLKCAKEPRNPIWLEEGLAVIVSGDDRFSFADFYSASQVLGIDIDYIKNNPNSWQEITLINPVVSYGAAEHYVRSILERSQEKNIGKAIVQYCKSQT